MPPARVATPADRRPLRSFAVAAAASAALLTAVLPGSAARADGAAGATVVGELVQAWPESGGHGPGEAQEPVSWVETASGEAVPVVTGDVDGVPAGSTVSVTVGGQVDAGESGEAHEVLDSEVIRTPAVLPAPAGPVTNQVTVVMVAPAGTPVGQRVDVRQMVDLVNGPVAAFWAEETGGAVSIGVTASHEWISTTAGCATPAALWNEAAAAVGFVSGPGKHLLLYVPPTAPGCAYALAEVGSSLTSGGRLYVSDTAASVIAHELGHNFGLAHSSGRQCDGTVDSGDCRTVGYRDYYDVMGASWAQTGSLNVVQAAYLGVLPASQVEHVTEHGSPVTVTLAPVSGDSGVRALQLTDAGGVSHWLEYRPAAGRDAWLGTDNPFDLDTGVLLRRTDRFPDTSVLLDGTPSSAAGWGQDLQVALTVGVPVSVSGGQFTIVLQATSASAAVLDVVPARPADPQGVPASPPGDPASGAVLPGAERAPVAAGPAGASATRAVARPEEQAAAAAAPELSLPGGSAAFGSPQPAAESAPTGGSAGLAVGIGAALAAAAALVVRTLRRPARG